MRELTRALGDFAPDLVSTHTAKAGWIGRAAAARLGLPAIYTPHGLPVGGRFSSASSLLFTIAERAAARWSAAIVCVSESEKRLALARRIAPPERLFVVHNGVRDVPPEYRACPDREPVRICSVARFERPKDFPPLIAALSRLEDRQWTLDLVGDGPLEPEIRRLATAHGIAERVRFLGYLPDPAPVLARSQIFVLARAPRPFRAAFWRPCAPAFPSWPRTSGVSTKRSAIVPRGCLCLPETPPRSGRPSPNCCAAPGLRREFGDRARGVFETRFRLEQTVEKMLALYATVLGKT